MDKKEGTKALAQQTESELDRLFALQELDRQRKEKAELVASLEREVTRMDMELTTLREAAAAARIEHDARDRQRRELEARLDEEEGKMKDRRMRLNRVRNEKELGALRREIEVGKEANQLLEADVLAALQAVETLETTRAEREAALAALEEQCRAQLVAHREQIMVLSAEAEAERLARDQLANSLSSALRGKYEQIFARRGGTTVVEIRNGTCMGCHMHVPPQFFNELQKYRDVRTCPNCNRILIWRPDAADASTPSTR